VAILGSVVVIAGTLLVNTSNFEPLYFIPAWFSSIDDLDHAWSMLRNFDAYQGELGVISSITPEARGFGNLLRLLERRQRLKVSELITGIQIRSQMLYGDDIQKIGQYVVEVRYESESEARVVAWVEHVSQWVMNERLRWSLLYGLPVLSVGLVLSLFAMLVPSGSKKGQSSSSSDPRLGRVS